MNYGPKMTEKMRRRLEADIKAFDKAKTLRLIEKNAVGRPDVDLSQEELTDGTETLSESKAVRWGRSNLPDIDLAIAQSRIHDLLTPSQWDAWVLVMQQSLTQEIAAVRLGVSQANVAQRLRAAKQRVIKYFTENK